MGSGAAGGAAVERGEHPVGLSVLAAIGGPEIAILLAIIGVFVLTVVLIVLAARSGAGRG
jgi:hypothetical protein